MFYQLQITECKFGFFLLLGFLKKLLTSKNGKRRRKKSNIKQLYQSKQKSQYTILILWSSFTLRWNYYPDYRSQQWSFHLRKLAKSSTHVNLKTGIKKSVTNAWTAAVCFQHINFDQSNLQATLLKLHIDQ